jgi:4-diphosphocytidyl-2-C-methyl-D-erythritol kinase
MARHTELAPAKINLGLKVLARRTDGYHEILSLLQTVDLVDRVTIEPMAGANRTVVETDAADVPGGPENLAFRAAEALRAATGADAGVRIALEKRIPAGGGLGGGSSDAAAVLRGLNRTWGLNLADRALHRVAADLGSDVPFFLSGGTAIARGRGEVLAPAAWPDRYHYLLVDPGFRIGTAWAYGKVRMGLTAVSEYAKLLNSRVESDVEWPDRLLRNLENDFLPLVASEHPQADDILDALKASGAVGSSLSGTGATLYGAFRTFEASRAGARAVREMGYRCFTCRATPGRPDPRV